jgi:hypothetical protein
MGGGRLLFCVVNLFIPNIYKILLQISLLLLLLTSNLVMYGQNCNATFTLANTFTNQTINVATVRGAAPPAAVTNIRITGTVNFNANVTFTNCLIRLDADAVINVNNLSTFTVQSASTIFACVTQWRAINVNNGGSIVFRNSNILNGRQGIVLNTGFNNANCVLTDNFFINNSSAITANGINNCTFATFSGNRFFGVFNNAGTIVRPLPPHGATEPIYGINLNNCAGTLGTSGIQNIFTGMSCAARINISNMTLNNCRFQFNNVLDWEGFGSGIGIWATNSTLTIQNIFSNGASCEFDNNNRAVRCDRTVGLVLKNARFTNQIGSDIEVVGSTNPYNIDISNNNIALRAPNGPSIFIDRAANTGGIHTRLKSNIINFPAPPLGFFLNGNRRIIDIQGRPGTSDQAIISDNQITCTYGNGNATNPISRNIDGIWIQNNADGYQVSGNIINYVNTFAGAPNANLNSVAIGMVGNNGMNNIIGPNNNVTTTLFPNPVNNRESWLRCGIHIDMSQNVAVCKNTADDPRHCYHFNANCANGEWGRNVMIDGVFGLIMSSNTTFPNQDYRMNQWLGTYQNTAIDIDGSNANTPWLVDNTLFGHLPPSQNPGGIVNPFPNMGVSGTPTCDVVLPPPPGFFSSPPTTKTVKKLLNNEYGLNTPVRRWDFEKTLLYQMIRFPASFADDALAQDYYATQQNTTIWKHAKAERMLHDAMELSVDEQLNIEQLAQNCNGLTDSLSKIEQLEDINAFTITPTLQSSKNDILFQLDLKRKQQSILLSSVSAQRSSKLNDVAHFISDLPAEENFEFNNKIILSLITKQLNNIEWTKEDSINLRKIAYQCREIDGDVVIIARGMLPVPERYSFSYEGDDPNCHRLRSSDQTLVAIDIEDSAKIWPNPADATINVGFEMPFTGTIEITNAAGHIEQSIQIDKSIVTKFSTEKLQSGVYFVRFIETGHRTKVQKIIIAH